MNTSRRPVARWIAAIAFAPVLAWAQEAPQLLRNPGFEEPLAAVWHKRTPETAKRRLYRCDTEAHSGKWCVALENVEAEYTRLRQGQDRSIVIEPGTRVELAAWVKSELTEDGVATLQLYCMSDKGRICSQPCSRGIAGPNGWTRLRILHTIPGETAYCMAYLQTKGGVGKVFFDDVSLQAIAPPKPPPPAPRVGLVTDLAEDDPCMVNLRVLFEDGLVPITEAAAPQQLAQCVGAAVLLRSAAMSPAVTDALTAFAKAGRHVFMDMRAFGRWQGVRTLAASVLSPDQLATWVFDGKEGTYDVAVHYADESDGESHMALHRNSECIDSWTLDATPENAKDAATVRKLPGVRLSPGDRLGLRLVPHHGEQCRVDAIELHDGQGVVRRVEAESMTLGASVRIESPALMFAKGIKASPSWRSRMTAGLRVVKESRAAAGFAVDQVMPRASYPGGTLHALPRDCSIPKLEVLAVTPTGLPGLVRLPVGRGFVVAGDVLSLREPLYRNVDAYYKYSPMTNVLTNPVRFGEYYPKRMTYAGVVEHMKQLAAEFDAIRIKDEGPACEGQRLYTLNLGRPSAPLYFLYAAAHGSEWEPGYGLMTFAKRVAQGAMGDVIDLDKMSIKILPIVNPTGYDRFKRQNVHGVDLNRQGDYRHDRYKGRDSNKDGTYGPPDYDWKGLAPFSEPESQTYKAIVSAANLYCVLDFHGNSSATSNKVGILPVTGHPDNEVRGQDLQQEANRNLRGRHLLKQTSEEAFSQYIITRVRVGGATPYLMNTACRDKFGILVELTAGYRDSYGTVLQTDVTCEVCRALFKANPVPAQWPQ